MKQRGWKEIGERGRRFKKGHEREQSERIKTTNERREEIVRRSLRRKNCRNPEQKS